jgi:hypothetical protein
MTTRPARLRSACLALALTVANTVGCGGGSASCEPGLCPIGTACKSATGRCEPVAATRAGPQAPFGRFSLLAPAPGKVAAVGVVPSEGSLAVFTPAASGWGHEWVAGPAAQDGEAAVEVATAATGPDGALHMVWLRASDRALWYGTGKSGAWQREPIAAATAGTIGRMLALALWQGRPVVAWRAVDVGAVKVSERTAAGSWTTALVTAPPRPGQDGLSDLGRHFALTVAPSGPALSAYDATAGDLVIAVRTDATWSSTRLAGSDPATGADTGDMGATSAIAVATTGELAVAYRDRGRGRVMVARTLAGPVAHKVALDEPVVDAQAGTVHTGIIGTALAIVLYGPGRAVVAAQDGLRLRVVVAVEQSGGGFQRIEIATAGTDPAPHLWPDLALAPDGGVLLGYVAIEPAAGPGGGRLHTWAVPGIAAVRP